MREVYSTYQRSLMNRLDRETREEAEIEQVAVSTGVFLSPTPRLGRRRVRGRSRGCRGRRGPRPGEDGLGAVQVLLRRPSRVIPGDFRSHTVGWARQPRRVTQRSLVCRGTKAGATSEISVEAKFRISLPSACHRVPLSRPTLRRPTPIATTAQGVSIRLDAEGVRKLQVAG
jgi:hypothetical protein